MLVDKKMEGRDREEKRRRHPLGQKGKMYLNIMAVVIIVVGESIIMWYLNIIRMENSNEVQGTKNVAG